VRHFAESDIFAFAPETMTVNNSRVNNGEKSAEKNDMERLRKIDKDRRTKRKKLRGLREKGEGGKGKETERER
jgi:hypothetical protein